MITPVRFKNQEQKEFVKTLRKRVDAYFKENNLPKSGGLPFKDKGFGNVVTLHSALFCFTIFIG